MIEIIFGILLCIVLLVIYSQWAVLKPLLVQSQPTTKPSETPVPVDPELLTSEELVTEIESLKKESLTFKQTSPEMSKRIDTFVASLSSIPTTPSTPTTQTPTTQTPIKRVDYIKNRNNALRMNLSNIAITSSIDELIVDLSEGKLNRYTGFGALLIGLNEYGELVDRTLSWHLSVDEDWLAAASKKFLERNNHIDIMVTSAHQGARFGSTIKSRISSKLSSQIVESPPDDVVAECTKKIEKPAGIKWDGTTQLPMHGVKFDATGDICVCYTKGIGTYPDVNFRIVDGNTHMFVITFATTPK